MQAESHTRNKEINLGVDYSPQYGAKCPACGLEHIQIITTMPWVRGVRKRYHRCQNCETRIVSIQADPTYKKSSQVDRIN